MYEDRIICKMGLIDKSLLVAMFHQSLLFSTQQNFGMNYSGYDSRPLQFDVDA